MYICSQKVRSFVIVGAKVEQPEKELQKEGSI